jgi:hypothetical protein
MQFKQKMQSILSGICTENKIQAFYCKWEYILSAVAIVLLCGGVVQVIYKALKGHQEKPSIYDCLKEHQEKPNEETKERRQNGRPKRVRKMTTSL